MDGVSNEVFIWLGNAVRVGMSIDTSSYWQTLTGDRRGWKNQEVLPKPGDVDTIFQVWVDRAMIKLRLCKSQRAKFMVIREIFLLD